MTPRRRTLISALSAAAAALLVVMVNARDQDRDPPTDLADALATSIVVIGAAVWLAARRLATGSRALDTCRSVAAGAAVGAAAVGLASVVYDPWAS